MKLHCPHCGVKGSAEDSFSGRKVTCPKCQGVFELKPDLAYESPEDSTLLSALSATSAESVAPEDEVEAPIVIDEDLEETGGDDDLSATEPELETTVPGEPGEDLDWADIASESDLQSPEGEKGAENEEMSDSHPVDFSSIQGELDQPADDEGFTEEEDFETEDGLEDDRVAGEEDPAEIEAAAHPEESSMPDSADFGNIESGRADDLTEAAAIAESSEERDAEDEVQLDQDTDKEELESSGVTKEQCWVCGKEDSVGDSFFVKDERLYCMDCLPIENPVETPDTTWDLDVDDTASASALGLSGDEEELADDATNDPSGKFSIGDAIRKAWAKTKGAKGTIWAGSAIMYLVLLVIIAGGAFLLPSLESDPTDVIGLVSSILYQTVTNIFSVLFTAGLLFMGIRKVAGDRISWKMIFNGFSCAGKIIVATILQSILVTIGFLLLVLPGIYLTVGYAMTLPLIVDKGLSPWQAMEMSRKAVHKVWWRVAGLLIVMGIIFVGSLLPLGIGLIWTWPMFIILAGVVYHYLFGEEEEAF